MFDDLGTNIFILVALCGILLPILLFWLLRRFL